MKIAHENLRHIIVCKFAEVHLKLNRQVNSGFRGHGIDLLYLALFICQTS